MLSIPVRRSAVCPLMMLAAVTAVLVGFGLASPAIADDEPRLLGVELDLVPTGHEGDGDPLQPLAAAEVPHYVALQVGHGGVTTRLRPSVGPVTVSRSDSGGATAAEIDGLRIGEAAEGFEATLGQVLSSPSLGEFVRIEAGDGGEPVAIDLQLPRSLRPGDLLLVQEAGGDDPVEIEGLGADGVALGATRTVGPPYRWNSGHQTQDGTAQWASVVEVGEWGADGTVAGLRVRSDGAEMKVLVLEPAVDQAAEAAIPVAVAGATGSTPSATVAEEASSGDPAPAPTTPVTTPTTPTAPAEAQPDEIDGPGQRTSALALTERSAPTALAMTGLATEPWVLVALATGFIFFGYTTVVAYRRPVHSAGPGERKGHAQLDDLGFD